MRRIKAALLAALCLFGTLPATALAWDSEPRLVLQEEGSRVYLTVEGLEDQVYGLQLELTLEGNCPDAAFTAEELDAYVPDCRVEAEGGETAVTIYMSALTGEDPISRDRRLYLGYLEPKGGCTLPDRARLILLDRDLRAYAETVSVGSDFRDGYDGDEYRISINDPDHGTLRVRPSFAEEGETVTITVSPDPGYELEDLTASFGRRDLRLTDRGGGSYTFIMPGGEVDVEASFRLREGGALPFSDIPEGFWCYDEVQYVYERGLMNGTGPSTFSPNGSTTRSMIVASTTPPPWPGPAPTALSTAIRTAPSAPARPSPGSSWRPFCTATPAIRGAMCPTGRTSPPTPILPGSPATPWRLWSGPMPRGW